MASTQESPSSASTARRNPLRFRVLLRLSTEGNTFEEPYRIEITRPGLDTTVPKRARDWFHGLIQDSDDCYQAVLNAGSRDGTIVLGSLERANLAQATIQARSGFDPSDDSYPQVEVVMSEGEYEEKKGLWDAERERAVARRSGGQSRSGGQRA